MIALFKHSTVQSQGRSPVSIFPDFHRRCVPGIDFDDPKLVVTQNAVDAEHAAKSRSAGQQFAQLAEFLNERFAQYERPHVSCIVETGGVKPPGAHKLRCCPQKETTKVVPNKQPRATWPLDEFLGITIPGYRLQCRTVPNAKPGCTVNRFDQPTSISGTGLARQGDSRTLCP